MGKSCGNIGIGWKIGGAMLAFGSIAHAEDGAVPAASPPATVTPAPTSTTKSPLIHLKRGKSREQKDIEGTEAPGRFEADTILKSPYSIGGQSLEVDPD